MSDATKILELAGTMPGLTSDRGKLKDALSRTAIDPAVQRAILAGDAVQVRALLGDDGKIYCSVFPTKVPPVKPPGPPKKAPRKAPAKKPAKKPARKAPGKKGSARRR